MEAQGPRFSSQPQSPDPRYVRTIQNRPFILYVGLMELATRMGLADLNVSVITHPTTENGNTVVCSATAILANGNRSTDLGESSEATLDPRVAKFVYSMASTRAKARALRNVTGVSMTCLEELGSFEEVIPGELGEDKTSPSTTSSASPAVNAEPQSQPSTSGSSTVINYAHNAAAPATDAQLKAINAIAKRRKFSGVELASFCRTATSKGLDELSKKDASKLIDSLKQAA